MVVVDYLQLMQGPTNTESRQQEISYISRSLKALARELRIPVVALSQLSRAPEQRTGENKRPQLSDLRESGAIEQDADLVMFIYRQEMYDGPTDKDGNSLEGRAEIIVGKQRGGVIGDDEWYPVVLVDQPTELTYRCFGVQESLGSEGSKSNNDFGLDQLELSDQIRTARFDFFRARISVSRRPMLEHVANEDLLAC